MARPKKAMSVSTGKIGKEERATRAKREKNIKLTRELLVPPSWLTPIAKKEFMRVVEETAKINILDNLDLSTIAIYADAYYHYVETSKYILKNGVTMERENNFGTYEVISPYLSAQEKYAKQIFSCSTKLGLATTDRLKLIVPTGDDEVVTNKFLKLLK